MFVKMLTAGVSGDKARTPFKADQTITVSKEVGEDLIARKLAVAAEEPKEKKEEA